MTWILKQLAGVFGPYIIGAMILIILTLMSALGYQTWTNHSLRTDMAEQASQFDQERLHAAQLVIKAQNQVRETERLAAVASAEVQLKHEQEIAREKAATQKLLADYRAGALKLRSSLTCGGGAGPSAPAHPAGSPAADQGGLQDADVQFLVRFAADADTIAGLANECRNQLRIDRGLQPDPIRRDGVSVNGP